MKFSFRSIFEAPKKILKSFLAGRKNKKNLRKNENEIFDFKKCFKIKSYNKIKTRVPLSFKKNKKQCQ